MYLENNRTRHTSIRIISAWAAAALLMTVIFVFSYQPHSATALFFGRIADFARQQINHDSIRVVLTADTIRTIVFGSLYLILSLLLAWALSCSGVHHVKNGVLVLLIGGFFALIDELRQLLTPGQISQLSDGLVAFGGILIGIILYQIGSLLHDIRSELNVRRDEAPRL